MLSLLFYPAVAAVYGVFSRWFVGVLNHEEEDAKQRLGVSTSLEDQFFSHRAS